MILIDTSSIIHRTLHSSIASAKPIEEDGKYLTSDFIGLAKYYFFQELFSIKQEHENNFGNLVLCLDESSNGYWRQDFYPPYKLQRRVSKADEENKINYDEVFVHFNALLDQISKNLPFKVVNVPKAEADDVILVLSREYSKFEKILIHSPDKDMIQAQKNTENVFQYSPLTKKWIVAENKHENMEVWLNEHICLGDAADGVPRVIDGTEFSESFLKFLFQEGHDLKNPMEFKANLDKKEKIRLIQKFNVYVLNRKGESTGIKDVYLKRRFGPSNLKKEISKAGSLDAWLDSHPMYRKHYNRNYTLVMEEGIPINIWNEITIRHKEAKTDYNLKEFEDYLKENNLTSILMNLPSVFKLNRELTAEDFDW